MDREFVQKPDQQEENFRKQFLFLQELRKIGKHEDVRAFIERKLQRENRRLYQELVREKREGIYRERLRLLKRMREAEGNPEACELMERLMEGEDPKLYFDMVREQREASASHSSQKKRRVRLQISFRSILIAITVVGVLCGWKRDALKELADETAVKFRSWQKAIASALGGKTEEIPPMAKTNFRNAAVPNLGVSGKSQSSDNTLDADPYLEPGFAYNEFTGDKGKSVYVDESGQFVEKTLDPNAPEKARLEEISRRSTGTNQNTGVYELFTPKRSMDVPESTRSGGTNMPTVGNLDMGGLSGNSVEIEQPSGGDGLMNQEINLDPLNSNTRFDSSMRLSTSDLFLRNFGGAERDYNQRVEDSTDAVAPALSTQDMSAQFIEVSPIAEPTPEEWGAQDRKQIMEEARQELEKLSDEPASRSMKRTLMDWLRRYEELTEDTHP